MELQTNIIYCGDCLDKLKELPDESIDLIYIDPPFSSNRNYVAFWQEQEKRHFEDRFENVREYLKYMLPRVQELYRVLKPTGSFYYHCDWHASHYIKTMLDREDLFGYQQFKNEIVWYYKTGGVSKNHFARKHDTIFYYTKTNDYCFKPIKEKSYLTHKYGFSNIQINQDEHGYYRDVYVRDVWDIPALRGNQPEISHYPTQKPETLLNRIIEASSKDGDIILDAFCGCGTTLLSAQKNKRKWIGIDISPTACRVVSLKLAGIGLKEGQDFIIRDLPKTAKELRQYPPDEFQNWAIYALGGVPNKIKVHDGGIDGKLYPIDDIEKEKEEGLDLWGASDRYIPIQVKRSDISRPEIDKFLTAIKRDKRDKGIFVAFSFTSGAEKEVRRIARDEKVNIQLITVDEIVQKDLNSRI